MSETPADDEPCATNPCEACQDRIERAEPPADDLREQDGDEPPRFYVASRTIHAAMWKELRSEGVPIISTWLDEAGIGETDDFSDLWRRCVDEVKRADRLVAFHSEGDVWKGAFIEIGVALGAGIPVTVVGDPPGSWLAHPLVSQASSVHEAVGLASPVEHNTVTPEPPADDLRERIARAIWTGTRVYGYWRDQLPGSRSAFYADADAVLAVPYEAAAPVTGDDLRDAVHLLDLAWGVIANADGWDGDTSWRQAAERWRDGYHRLLDDIRTTAPTPPPVPPWPDGVLRDAANRLRWIANSGYIEDPGIKRIIRSWADELDATPVPPWPGAVLSGLVDEDGQPTWLAQAPNVQGEAVRTCVGFPWFICGSDNATTPYWVEVRAPRAPETERVPWWEALGRLDPNDGRIVAVEHLADRSPRVYFDPQTWVDVTRPDGTVEVLKDGES